MHTKAVSDGVPDIGPQTIASNDSQRILVLLWARGLMQPGETDQYNERYELTAGEH
mgnify:CR=1 FL=1